jgi:hypothetical protein
MELAVNGAFLSAVSNTLWQSESAESAEGS